MAEKGHQHASACRLGNGSIAPKAVTHDPADARPHEVERYFLL
jgi:hypothetical protein